jgi:hypothetical protein
MNESLVVIIEEKENKHFNFFIIIDRIKKGFPLVNFKKLYSTLL